MLYADLQSAVAARLNRTDLYSEIPTFIQLCEAKLNRRLRVREMVVNATTSINAEFETVPLDFAGAISMKVQNTDGTQRDLAFVSPDAMAWRKQHVFFEEGVPRFCAVVGSSFEFGPIPDQGYTADLVYYAQLPALSAATTSNWLLAKWPDLYLYGTLAEAGDEIGDRRAGNWTAKVEALLAEADLATVNESFAERIAPHADNVV